MATVGRAKAVAQFRGLKVSGFFAWILWCSVHLLLLVGFRNRWRVFSEWISNYFTFKRGVQLITNRTNCHNCSPSPTMKPGWRTHSKPWVPDKPCSTLKEKTEYYLTKTGIIPIPSVILFVGVLAIFSARVYLVSLWKKYRY